MSNIAAISQNTSDSLYKKMFLDFLSKMQKGVIYLLDGKEEFVFGENNCKMSATITVLDQAFYKNIFWRGDLGFAEGYINQNWQTDNLTMLLSILANNLALIAKVDKSVSGIFMRLWNTVTHYLNKNNLDGARKNIYKHYDLSNNFFKLFLDPTMMYSSAIFASQHDTLEQASINKLRTICDKLRLKPTDHLLEIGTGWGSLAIYAAQNYNCKVTTTTISTQQFEYASEKVKSLGLEDQILVIKKDYRQLDGAYDKLVSVEMIEAVGHQYFANYFNTCSKLVKPNGLFLLQAITIQEQRYARARDSVDFIKKHIFPGCCIPSITEIMRNIEKHTEYNLLNMQDLTADYALTLKHWRESFIANKKNIIQLGFDEEFIRKWVYYFSYCEAGFAERAIFDWQLLFGKHEFK